MGTPKQRAPTLWVIILIKLVKGLALLFLALGLYKMVGADLAAQFERLLDWVNLDPEKKLFSNFADWLEKITPANIKWVATGTFLYSLFSLIEGIGLIFRVSWAGWMAIGESAFFIPIEVYKLSDAFSVTVLVILLINIFIVVYLYRNRHRLFHHFHAK